MVFASSSFRIVIKYPSESEQFYAWFWLKRIKMLVEELHEDVGLIYSICDLLRYIAAVKADPLCYEVHFNLFTFSFSCVCDYLSSANSFSVDLGKSGCRWCRAISNSITCFCLIRDFNSSVSFCHLLFWRYVF